MFFEEYTNFISIYINNFLGNYKYTLGILKNIKIDRYLFPFDHSSIDRYSKESICKFYNEYLERTKIGFNTFLNHDNITVINLISNSSYKRKRNCFGYGFNKNFGVMDTTGSSSGICCEYLKNKAISELIEKNELMLFWYKGLGKVVVKDDLTKNLVEKYGLNVERTHVFLAKNISNLTTLIVIILDAEGDVVGTGINANLSPIKAFQNAILEAKLLEWVYKNGVGSPYCKNNKNVTRYIYYLNDLLSKARLENHKGSADISNSVKIDSWVKNIELGLLNTNKHQREVTVKCISKDLINCVPTKKNLKKMKNKKIIRLYNIIDELSFIPDCTVV